VKGIEGLECGIVGLECDLGKGRMGMNRGILGRRELGRERGTATNKQG